MRSVIFKTEIFKTPRDIARGEIALDCYLYSLFTIDKAYLRDYPNTLRIYDSNVRYEREPNRGKVSVGGEILTGVEIWKSVPEILRDGFGDCEDLACWRAAELLVRDGIDAKPFWSVQMLPGTRLYHIRVRLPDGSIEDPSKRLGMK